jgi:hypothetical protein
LPPDQFEVNIDRLVLNTGILATVPRRNPSLVPIITPAFATRNQLRWTSSNSNAATIDLNTGAITVTTEAVTVPISTIIRVEAVYDPSKYDICILTVHPAYPRTRRWTWSTNPGISGDIDVGDGGTLLFGTGNGSEYNPGNRGPGVYVIDPEDPFEFGVIPEGGLRTAGTFTPSNSAFINGSGQFLYPATYNYSHHIRTTGNAARVMRIAALFAPFTIVVNYQSNGDNERNADIRIGDKEGLRIEGRPATNNNTNGARTVWYSYDPTDDSKPEFGMDQFVPLVFVESNQGLRLYAVYVLEGVYEVSGGVLVPKQ